MTELPQKDFDLTEQQNKTLQEVANIGLNLANDSLACTLKTIVRLSNLRITASNTSLIRSEITSKTNPVIATRQGFFNHWQGESILILNEESDHNKLTPHFGLSGGTNENTKMEVLLDASSIISNTYINGFTKQLTSKAEVRFTAPSIITTNSLKQNKTSSEQCLLLTANLHFEESDFRCYSFILLSLKSAATLKKDLDAFEEEL